MTRWPFWRLLIWVEAWLLAVAAFHRSRPIHEDFVVPLLIGVLPGIAFVAFWGLARAAVGDRPAAGPRASWLELGLTLLATAAAAVWVYEWTMQAREDVERLDEVLGEATIIIDVSLTGLSATACIAALALDWALTAAHEPLRAALAWLRRAHLVATVSYVLALFGSAWLFMQWPDTAGSDATLLSRARLALHVNEFAKATVLPVQALFAALALLVVAIDSRAGR